MKSTPGSTHYNDSPHAAGGRGLEQVIDGLERRLDELAESQRVTRLVMLGGSALLLTLIGFFGLSLYSLLQRQLSVTELQNAFMAKIDEIAPPLSQKFLDSALDATPAYGTMAVARLEKIRPRLETMLLGEAEKFSEELQATLLAKAEAGMQQVTDRVSQDLKARIPSLTERKLDAIEHTLRESLIVEGGGIADELQAKAVKERDRVEKLLEKLPVDTVAQQNEEKLYRQLVHHVLMVIDRTLTAESAAAQ